MQKKTLRAALQKASPPSRRPQDKPILSRAFYKQVQKGALNGKQQQLNGTQQQQTATAQARRKTAPYFMPFVPVQEYLFVA
ncbi:MAG: hypothetical protein MR993_00280 [Spirochaetes bacterium]|nr:hypothetical protein [Spirochaetota bacterium]